MLHAAARRARGHAATGWPACLHSAVPEKVAVGREPPGSPGSGAKHVAQVAASTWLASASSRLHVMLRRHGCRNVSDRMNEWVES